ncbi:MAG: histidine kinase, partial [Myxococcota bacterium]
HAFRECVQMLIILGLARPYADAEALVSIIALPMISMNAIGAGLFASIVEDQHRSRELHAAHYARLALEVGEKSIGLLKHGLTRDAADRLVELLRETLPVAAVAVTGVRRRLPEATTAAAPPPRREPAEAHRDDHENVVLAFGGLGEDHHHAGNDVRCSEVLDAVKYGRVEFLDGDRSRYRCPIDPHCPLSSALIVPFKVDEEVLGTIILFEPRGRPFTEVFRSFGEGLANLLSAQLLQARLQEQRKLLISSELKLLQAQINPHFLFNALTAIRAVVPSDPAKARELIGHLGDFLRNNLREAAPDVSLAEELALVGAYLEIEKARFGERLSVDVDVPGDYATVRLPTFTLQPLVENAIKHGLSDKVDDGRIRISATREGGDIVLAVEDNGGTYVSGSSPSPGLGLSLVDRRVSSWGGPGYGTSVSCDPGHATRVSVRIPSRTNP